jgi:5-(carboxyamino)imidazole ribonucleotide mutase
VPVATLAIGKAGAVNAALTAVAIAALQDPALKERYQAFRQDRAEQVRKSKLPPLP